MIFPLRETDAKQQVFLILSFKPISFHFESTPIWSLSIEFLSVANSRPQKQKACSELRITLPGSFLGRFKEGSDDHLLDEVKYRSLISRVSWWVPPRASKFEAIPLIDNWSRSLLSGCSSTLLPSESREKKNERRFYGYGLLVGAKTKSLWLKWSTVE